MTHPDDAKVTAAIMSGAMSVIIVGFMAVVAFIAWTQHHINISPVPIGVIAAAVVIAAAASVPAAEASGFNAVDFLRYVVGLEDQIKELKAENEELKRQLIRVGNIPPNTEIGRNAAYKEWNYYRSWIEACNPLTLNGDEAVTAFFKHGSADIRTQHESKAQPPWYPASGHRWVCGFTYHDDINLRTLTVKPDNSGGFHSKSYYNDAPDCFDRYQQYTSGWGLVRFIEQNACGAWPTRGR